MKTLILFVLFSFPLFAAPEAQVVLLKGSATFDGKPVSVNQIFTGQGEIKVAEKSYLRIQFKEGKHTVALAANSVSKLDFTDPQQKDSLALVKGYARWVSGSEAKSASSGIRTKNATMGIRGTNFMSLYNDDLGETEIWVFDGQVNFANNANKADNKQITKNQWGGIGGRFGKKCQDVITLPPEIISKVDQILPIDQ